MGPVRLKVSPTMCWGASVSKANGRCRGTVTEQAEGWSVAVSEATKVR